MPVRPDQHELPAQLIGGLLLLVAHRGPLAVNAVLLALELGRAQRLGGLHDDQNAGGVIQQPLTDLLLKVAGSDLLSETIQNGAESEILGGIAAVQPALIDGQHLDQTAGPVHTVAIHLTEGEVCAAGLQTLAVQTLLDHLGEGLADKRLDLGK